MRKYVLFVVALTLLLAGFASADVVVRNVPSEYTTIEAAVTAANSGDTIQIAAGTYIISDAQLAISNKSITITGAGAGETVISPSLSTGSSADARGWFFVSAGASLKLSNVTLDGTGKNIYQAIRSLGNVVVEDCVIQNMIYPGYAGFGIAIMGGKNNVVRRCTMSNIGRVGTIVFGDGVRAFISDYSYTGKGSGDALDYGVEIGGGGYAYITRANISNCVAIAKSDGSTSAGILASTYYGSGTAAKVTDSTIYSSTAGIAVGYNASDTTILTAHNNNLQGNMSGISSFSTATVDASSNWWGTASGPAENYIEGNVIVTPFRKSSVLATTADPTLDTLQLLVSAGSRFVKSGDPVYVTLAASDTSVPAAGYVAYIAPSNGLLTSPAYDTVGLPFGLTMWSDVTSSAISLQGGSDVQKGEALTQVGGPIADLSFVAAAAPSEGGTTSVGFNSGSSLVDGIGYDFGTTCYSEDIVIDNTAPTGLSISANPDSWTNADSIALTFDADDAGSGIDHYELSLGGGAYFVAESPYALSTAAFADGVYSVAVKAIDKAGNEAESIPPASVSFDNTPPSISIVSAMQGSKDVLVSGNALKGDVVITVSASDATSGLASAPVLNVTDAEGSVTSLEASGSGPWTYTYKVDESTPNGSATITADVADKAGNTKSATGSFNVNKTTVTVNLELMGVSTTVTRSIKIAAAGQNKLHDVVFQPENADLVRCAKGQVVFEDVSNVGTKASAKDEQHTLRTEGILNNDPDGNQQYQVTLQLIGGDATNDNIIDIRDYGVFAGQFGTLGHPFTGRDADFSCNGSVGTEDFGFIQVGFLHSGDNEVVFASGMSAQSVRFTAAPSGALSSISVKELAKTIGMGDARKADVNKDGVVDTTDMMLFLQKNAKKR